jgi:hypothetical protein
MAGDRLGGTLVDLVVGGVTSPWFGCLEHKCRSVECFAASRERREVSPRLLLALRATGLAAATLLAAGTASAQAPAEGNAAAVRPDAPVTLVVDLQPGSPLGEQRLVAAIARELGAPVVREPGAQGGTLVVQQQGEAVTVSFDGPPGRRERRTIPLDPDPTRAEQDIALTAVNVARDQAAAFRLLVPPPPQAPTQAPAPPSPPTSSAQTSLPSPTKLADAPQSPCARTRSSPHARLPIGVDFAPFAGTSSVDGGSGVRALSIGVLGTVSGGVRGTALSGLVNLDRGPVCGVELAGLVNVAEGFDGVQLAGIVDVAAGDSTGVQAGLVNVTAGSLRGLQAGLVSVAGDTNVQVGLVNVANNADVQLGLVNVDVHGRLRLDAWTKPEAGTVLAAIKHGPAHFHWIYAFEMNASSGRPWAALGLGSHSTPSDRLYVDVDLMQHVQIVPTGTAPNQLSELRLVLGYTVVPHLSAFVGPTFNVLVAPSPSRADAPGYAAVWADTSTTTVRAWPGAVLGVEVL